MEETEALLDHLANLTAQGHAERARDLVAPFERVDPLRYRLGHASIAAAANDLEGLREHAAAAMKLAPEAPLALHAAAMSALLAGDGEQAERYARHALSLDDSTRSRRGLANILLRSGKLEDAERALREIVARAPGDGYALKQLGRVRAMRGDEAGALSYLAKAFAASPDDMEPVELAITLYRDAGWAIGALTLSRVTRQGVHPPEVNVLLDLIALMLMARISPDAPGREAFDASLEAAQGLVSESAKLSPAAQLRAARALVDTGRPAEALAVVRRVEGAIDAAEDRAELAYVRGLAHDNAGDDDAALSAYEAAVEAHEGAWEAACNAVHVALKTGELERAGAVLARVPEELKRLRPQLLFNEAVWLVRSGRRDEARAHARHLRANAAAVATSGLIDELIDELDRLLDEEE